MSEPANQNRLRNFLGSLTGNDQLQLEKSRLEAFLAAFPGDYCGFAPDGSVIYSKTFPTTLGLSSIENIHDIQNALSTSDAAVLEGMFGRLQETGKTFQIDVSSQDSKKYYELTGTRGQAINHKDFFDILWIKDVTRDKAKALESENAKSQMEQEIRKMQTVLDGQPAALWIRDAQAELIWCNQGYARIIGDSPAAVLINQREISFVAKDKTKSRSFKDMAREAIKSGSPQTNVGYIITEGKRNLYEVTESPLPGSNYILGVARDISREEEIDKELNRHLSANKSLMEQLRSAICIFAADQRLEFYNTSFSELWGLDDQYLNTRPKLGDIMEKLRDNRRLPEQADFKKFKNNWLEMFTRLIDPYEDTVYLPDDTVLRILVMPHPMGGLMMNFEDVTSRLKLESSYNTLVAVQKETLDNLAEGVAVYGGDGRIKLYNPSFTELWGLNPEDLMGQPHISQLSEKMSLYFDDQERPARKKEMVAQAIERNIQEGRLSRNNGSLVEFNTVPLPDGGVLVSYFDVTDAAKVENALREKNAALEQAEKLKTDFLANVSYQLRTPLNAIMGFAEILHNQYFGKMTDKQMEYSAGIQEAGHKLVSLIDDILDLATIEAGYLDLTMDKFEIGPMLVTLNDLVKDWTRKEKIDVKLAYDKKIGTLVADERRIKQVLLNLIHNAITYTPEGGSITIAAEKTKDHAIFSVSDTGIGISKADLKRVFEPFERANHEHRADMSPQALSRGAGLGLSLVKNIVELHGGTVAIESEISKGTAVTLQIPLEPIIDPIL